MPDTPPPPPKPKPSWFARRRSLTLILGLIAAGDVALHLQHPDSATFLKPAPRPPIDPALPISLPDSMARRFVGAQLKDPDSARYRHASYRRRQGQVVVCGEVNSRNSLGGYTGFESFILVGSQLFVDDGRTPHFSRGWKRECEQTDHDDGSDKRALPRHLKEVRHHGA